MTEEERINRETLLKRAAAVAGAVYVAPALTSSAAAETVACSGQPCQPGRKGRRKCKKKGGKTCTCIEGRCRETCVEEERCAGVNPPCVPRSCGVDPGCVCLSLLPGDLSGGICVNRGSGPCEDHTPCDPNTGEGCAAGECCMAACCGEPICLRPCGG